MKLSVCIPSIREDEINKAVKSVLDDLDNHDFEHEILVGAVGGFSFELENHCKVIETPEKWTAVQNRNHLLDHSSGKYIGMLDDDDRWIEGRIEKTLPFLEDGFDLVGSWVKNDIPSVNRKAQPLERMCLTHSSFMFRSGWKYRSKFFLSQDYDLLLRMYSSGCKIGGTDFKLVERDLKDSHEIGGGSRPVQEFLSYVAKIFCYQRLHTGSDGYEDWEIEPFCSLEKAKESLTRKVLVPPPVPIECENKIVEI